MEINVLIERKEKRTGKRSIICGSCYHFVSPACAIYKQVKHCLLLLVVLKHSKFSSTDLAISGTLLHLQLNRFDNETKTITKLRAGNKNSRIRSYMRKPWYKNHIYCNYKEYVVTCFLTCYP